MSAGWLVAGILYILGAMLAADRTMAIDVGERMDASFWEYLVVIGAWPLFTLALFIGWVGE